ncbi:MAG: hypothetical protein ABI481_06425, partial [Pyrinomonadaceae bacterium]
MSWLYSLVFAGLLFSSNGEELSNRPQNSAAALFASQTVVTDEIEKFEQTYPLTKNGNVSVSNVNGSIVVEAWDREEVKLTATKIGDSKESLAEVELEQPTSVTRRATGGAQREARRPARASEALGEVRERA